MGRGRPAPAFGSCNSEANPLLLAGIPRRKSDYAKKRAQPPISVVHLCSKQSGSTSEIRMAAPIFARATFCRGLLGRLIRGKTKVPQTAFHASRLARHADGPAEVNDLVGKKNPAFLGQ